MVVVLSDDEIRALETQHRDLTGTVTFTGPGIASVSGENVDELRRLFAGFPERLEHMPASRRFGRGQVTSLQLGSSATIDARLRWSDRTADKFQNFKSDLLMWDYLDSKVPRPRLGRIDGIKRVIQDFLVEKDFIGVEFREGLAPKFPIESPRGRHEIDDLSSGEQEILMTLGTLVAREHGHSTILWDEPDLHLHGTAEVRLPSFIDLLASSSANQVWVATHSPEIVNSIDTGRHALIRMPGGAIGENVARRIERSDDRVKVLESLGASLYAQTVFRHIVWHEGDSDKEILVAYQPSLTKSVCFISAGGGVAVERLSSHLAHLVQEALQHSTLIAIRDRDSRIELSQPTGDDRARVFMWRRREIENYLLDEEAIRIIHSSLSRADQFATAADVLTSLRSIADDRRPWIIAKMAERQLNEKIVSAARLTIDPSDSEGTLESSREEILVTLQAQLESRAARTEYLRVKNAVDGTWQTEWKSLCPGKQVLIEFHRRHVRNHMSYDQYRDLIAQTQVLHDRIHEDVSSVLQSMDR